MRIVRLILMLGVALFAGWYLYTHGGEFALLLRFDVRYLPLLLMVTLSGPVINGLILRGLVEQFSVRLRFQEWYGLTMLHGFGYYLPVPLAGAAARGIYLKKVHGLDYSRFTSTGVVTSVGFVSTVGFLGLLTLSVMRASSYPSPWPLWLLFVGLALTVILLTPSALSWPLIKRWHSFIGGLETLRKPHVFLTLAAKQVLWITLEATGIWLAFQSLGRPIPWTSSLLLALITLASGVINVTPGNLGVAESAAWITAHFIHVDPDEAVVAYTLVRLIYILMIFSLTPYYLDRLSRVLEAQTPKESTIL